LAVRIRCIISSAEPTNDTAGHARRPVAYAEPWPCRSREGVTLALAEVAVQRSRGVIAELDDALLAALACDDGLPAAQIQIGDSEPGQLGQAHAGIPEQRQNRGIAPVLLTLPPASCQQRA